jgi:ubiquinone/menaquinone biosynthesis C-methylase UbiE
MAADYDRFSRQFKKSREFPFRTCIEEFMMLQMLGNLAGLTALDLACGEGHYARMLRRHGATRVIGVDISEGYLLRAFPVSTGPDSYQLDFGRGEWEGAE